MDAQEMDMDSTAIAELVTRLTQYNAAYRAGQPVVSDHEYDELVETLRKADPEHPFLHTVEPEALRNEGTVRHKERMLSTEKAYTSDALRRFVERVEKAAFAIGRTTRFRVTPSLMAWRVKTRVVSSPRGAMDWWAMTLPTFSIGGLFPSEVGV